jgi:hypothetical protein
MVQVSVKIAQIVEQLSTDRHITGKGIMLPTRDRSRLFIWQSIAAKEPLYLLALKIGNGWPTDGSSRSRDK